MPNTQHTDANKSTKSKYMSDERREKLLTLQRKEQLKGLLVNKFKAKFGGQSVASSVINMEVGNFLKNEKLTEDNLKRLEERIQKGAGVVLGSQGAKSVRSELGRSQSQRAMGQTLPPIQAGRDRDDVASVKSYATSRMSGATNLSKAGANKNMHEHGEDDMQSVYSNAKSARTIPALDEEDEWAAIQKFNTLLHYEEMRQTAMKEAERKRLIKQELDRQLEDKHYRKYMDKDEDHKYNQLQTMHLGILENREKEKEEEAKRKILNEKASRDKQLKEENMRKRIERRQQMEQEADQVKRLQHELDSEKQAYLLKRKQEYEYLQKVLRENDENKRKQTDDKHQQRLSDIRAQEEYTKVLDRQEQDRILEFQAREKRAQDYMGRMADTVIKDMDKRAQFEEDRIKNYEAEKERRDRIGDENRQRKLKMTQHEMRRYLDEQIEERKQKGDQEKMINTEQAEMWRQDVKNFTEEEKKLFERLKGINKDNAEFLKKQMDEKKKKNRNMNYNEYLLNKQLLRDINEKKKSTTGENFLGIEGVGVRTVSSGFNNLY